MSSRTIVPRRTTMVVLAITTGLISGWLAPSSTGPGVFIPITATLAAGSLMAGGALPRTLASRTYLAIAGVLALVPVVWAAEWVAVISILGVCASAALAVRTPKTWGSFLKAATGPLGRLPLTPGFLIKTFRTGGTAPTQTRAVLKGVSIAVPLVLVFGALFASADAVFARAVERFFRFDLGELPVRAFVSLLLTCLTTAYAMSSVNLASVWPGPVFTGRWGPLFDKADDGKPVWRMKPTEWTIALISLDALFIAFVAIQITVLFAGRQHVLETAGLTYSEYARSGFFQLLVSGALTMGVLAVAGFWASTSTPNQKRRLDLLLLLLCTMTLVVLASAFKRLSLYEEAYGYTRARFIAYAVIIWMAGMFLITIAAHAANRRAHLPTVTALFTGLALMTAMGIGPDSFIAAANVARYEATGRIDTSYLSTLSTDALPAINRLPKAVGRCPIDVIAYRYSGEEHWGSFNLSRARWRERLTGSASRSIPPPACPRMSEVLP